MGTGGTAVGGETQFTWDSMSRKGCIRRWQAANFHKQQHSRDAPVAICLE